MAQVFRPHDARRWTWIRITGPDAQDFLHRITTVNVRSLAPGQGQEGCLLTPQGRFRAFFTLWCLGTGAYGFELEEGPDGHWKKEFLAAIDQYTFAEKLTVQAESDLTCAWILGEGSNHPPGTVTESQGLILCNHGESMFGTPWLSVWGPADALNEWLKSRLDDQPVDDHQIESWRIRSLQPRVGSEIRETTNPLEVNLRKAISDNKGCYPGQEVIEKIIALGSPARRLARLEGSGEMPPLGQKFFTTAPIPQEAGELTSVASTTQGGFIGLALIKKTHAKDGLDVRFENGSPASIRQVAPAGTSDPTP